MSAPIALHFETLPRKVSAREISSLAEMSFHEQEMMRGYVEGWTKAHVECRQEAENRIQASRKHWDDMVQSLNSVPREVILRLQNQLVELAFSTVRKILAATPITRDEVMAQVKQMLDKAESGAEIEIQLNPEDLALLTAEDKNALWNENLMHLKWTSNPSVGRGGCVLRGEFGWIDGRRETRMNRLERVATESLPGARPS